MSTESPFFKSIPYRNIVLDLKQEPIPQYNGREWRIENAVMNDYDLFICDRGCALFDIDGTEYHLEEGMALLVSPGQKINARTHGDKAVSMLAQHFMLNVFHSTDFFSLIRYSPCVKLKKWELVKTLSYEIVKVDLTKGQKWKPLDTAPLFMVLLKFFIEDAYLGKNTNQERKSSLVLSMMARIDENYNDPDLLDKLTAQSSFSYSHTANIFKKLTGLSPKAYITERKIEASKEILLKGGSVREGADAAGYKDEFYFSRMFKKYTGLSPRDFRKRL